MSYRILIAGLLAGLFAGLITSVLQQALTVPIIHIAETFETGHHDHAAPDAAATPDANAGHVHDASAWAPSEGLERIAFTTLATVGACIGFAFILVAGMILLGEAPSARRGLIWGGWGDPRVPPFSLGYVSLIGFALIAPTSIIATPWGVKLAHTIPPLLLKRAFAVFLAITSARMFWSIFT